MCIYMPHRSVRLRDVSSIVTFTTATKFQEVVILQCSSAAAQRPAFSPVPAWLNNTTLHWAYRCCGAGRRAILNDRDIVQLACGIAVFISPELQAKVQRHSSEAQPYLVPQLPLEWPAHRCWTLEQQASHEAWQFCPRSAP